MAVSTTKTLLSLWGSGVSIPGTGILMNNGMMWFDPQPGRPNSVAGGKKPLSNMAPIVVARKNRALAAIGASGGRRILNCNVQIALNVIERGQSMQECDKCAPHRPSLRCSLSAPGSAPSTLSWSGAGTG